MKLDILLNPDLRLPGDPALGELAPIKTQIFYPLEVRQSALAADIGQGVFAAAPIAQGSVIVIGGGQVTSSISAAPCDYTGIFDEHYHIAPLDFDAPTPNWLMNHSCASNTRLIGRLVILARRDIAVGEELTVDYSTVVAGNHPWRMECRCGGARCRRLITNEDWRDSLLFALLFEEWPVFIQRYGLMTTAWER